MSYFIESVAGAARFSAEKMTKNNLAEGSHLTLGLNCFEPGQKHATHAHAASDKAYYVVSGEGRFDVAGEEQQLGAGALVFAPAGIPHGVINTGSERLVLLVTIAPPIQKKG